MVVCVDSAFAVNKDESSQLGVLVMLRDEQKGDANIIQYSFCKSKRVCKSVLPSELFLMLDEFDVGFTVARSLESMFARKVALTMATDIQSLYDLCPLLWQTTERLLQIGLSLTREAYKKR